MSQRDKVFLLVTITYWLLALLWQRSFSPSFLIGGAVGFVFLPFFERIVGRTERSVVESILFQIPLAVLSLYAVSALTSKFGQGFILTLFLQTLLAFNSSWFWPVKGGVTRFATNIYFLLMLAVFLYSSSFLR